jgi:hypothetical protein
MDGRTIDLLGTTLSGSAARLSSTVPFDTSLRTIRGAAYQDKAA